MANSTPGEAATRDHAYHLREQSGRVPGRDPHNGLEASPSLHAHAAVPASLPSDTAQPQDFGAPEPGRVSMPPRAMLAA